MYNYGSDSATHQRNADTLLALLTQLSASVHTFAVAGALPASASGATGASSSVLTVSKLAEVFKILAYASV